jgi:hypothetical protein
MFGRALSTVRPLTVWVGVQGVVAWTSIGYEKLGSPDTVVGYLMLSYRVTTLVDGSVKSDSEVTVK